MTRAFGIYVHIPYCLQICTYCDFVKFESRDLPPSGEYISLLQRELKTRALAFGSRELTSVYFGGGTPSLFTPQEILTILNSITNKEAGAGFPLAPNAEITLEINPGTLTAKSIDEFLRIGITRFSVGAQTFDESLLKVTGRKHSVKDTIETLALLRDRGVNYSFDLLFGLPGQRLEGLQSDVARALEFKPSHLSAYNLTVPAKHPLNAGRASDDEQAEMFEFIESELRKHGILRYEVSNFAKPGFESQHNLLYWSDAPYWGLGIGSHSYIPRGVDSRVDEIAPWGTRFWNPATIAAYRTELDRVSGPTFWKDLKPERFEKLAAHEALTDFTHTALRSQKGLSNEAIRAKFGERAAGLVQERLQAENLKNFLSRRGEIWALSPQGQAMADRVFEAMTFLADDKIV